MRPIPALPSRKPMNAALWPLFGRPPATPPAAGNHRDPGANFAAMRLLKRRRVVDALGRWWVVEERQCLHTGLLLRRTRRITD